MDRTTAGNVRLAAVAERMPDAHEARGSKRTIYGAGVLKNHGHYDYRLVPLTPRLSGECRAAGMRAGHFDTQLSRVARDSVGA